MLSFKQYLQKYPNGDKAKSSSKSQKKILKDRLSETVKQVPEQGTAMSKWDLIRLIAEDEGETVVVELNQDRVIFQFVEVEIE